MTFHAMTERYEEITVCGKPALFTSIRIKRDTVPDGLYAYDVRHDDECQSIPCEIAPFVMVNHWGTIILAEPLELPDDHPQVRLLVGWYALRKLLFISKEPAN